MVFEFPHEAAPIAVISTALAVTLCPVTPGLAESEISGSQFGSSNAEIAVECRYLEEDYINANNAWLAAIMAPARSSTDEGSAGEVSITAAPTQAPQPQRSDFATPPNVDIDVHRVMCWASRSDDPLGFLKDPRPYTTGDETGRREVAAMDLGHVYYNASRHTFMLKVLLRNQAPHAVEVEQAASKINLEDQSTPVAVFERLLETDECLSVESEDVVWGAMGAQGPPGGIDSIAWVRVDRIFDLAQCPSVEKISFAEYERP